MINGVILQTDLTPMNITNMKFTPNTILDFEGSD